MRCKLIPNHIVRFVIPLLFCAYHFTNLDSTHALHPIRIDLNVSIFVSNLMAGMCFLHHALYTSFLCISFSFSWFVLLLFFLEWAEAKTKPTLTSEKKRNSICTLNRALLNMKNTNEHGIIAMYSELFTQLNESDSAAHSYQVDKFS